MRRCHDFDWIEGLNILPLEVGDKILGRWKHKDAGRQWFPGKVVRIQTNQNGDLVHDICYDDDDYEEGVLRVNIKGRETRNGPDGRPGPYLKYKEISGREIDPPKPLRREKSAKRVKTGRDMPTPSPDPPPTREPLASGQPLHTKSVFEDRSTVPRGGSHPPTSEVDGGGEEVGEEPVANSRKLSGLMDETEAREHRQKAKVVAFVCFCICAHTCACVRA